MYVVARPWMSSYINQPHHCVKEEEETHTEVESKMISQDNMEQQPQEESKQIKKDGSSSVCNPCSHLGEWDVTFGRSKETRSHIGYVRFQELVKHRQRAYLTARRTNKTFLADEIFSAITAKGGRFLRSELWIDGQKHWFELGRQKAMSKILQTLRESTRRMVSMEKVDHSSQSKLRNFQPTELNQSIQMEQPGLSNSLSTTQAAQLGATASLQYASNDPLRRRNEQIFQPTNHPADRPCHDDQNSFEDIDYGDTSKSLWDPDVEGMIDDTSESVPPFHFQQQSESFENLQGTASSPGRLNDKYMEQALQPAAIVRAPTDNAFIADDEYRPSTNLQCHQSELVSCTPSTLAQGNLSIPRGQRDIKGNGTDEKHDDLKMGGSEQSK